MQLNLQPLDPSTSLSGMSDTKSCCVITRTNTSKNPSNYHLVDFADSLLAEGVAEWVGGVGCLGCEEREGE